ncbi:hypothetical protein [Bacillus sp. FJAT-50079]|uniref:hypothetical protein n=1 Tax=Bacillus sp. FJAT-50079 TaxID=2833577 RepID=UPI001BCA31C6|nr:hypothetical protein [Bacillus sp. FJAT-50079]MBS4206669.1 hypothetical protein [Bacillus sp. FJAT-50079]
MRKKTKKITNSTTNNAQKGTFKQPNKFFANKITRLASFFIVLLSIIYVFSNGKQLIKYVKAIGGLILKKAESVTDLNSLYLSFLCFLMFVLLILSFYIMRASYFDIDHIKGWKKWTSRFTYYMGNIYIVILEVIIYCIIFMIAFSNSLPNKAGDGVAAMEHLFWPIVKGLGIMVVFYIILSLILWRIFQKIYGGLVLLEELKWNRDGVEIIASALFIISIISSMISIAIEEYKFNNSETQLLFGVFVFTISLYVIKCIKNFIITYCETK